jgi:hypothetical protein
LVSIDAAVSSLQALSLSASGPSVQQSARPVIAIKADNLLNGGHEVFHIADIDGVTGRAAPVQLDLPPFRPTDYLLLSFRGLPKDFALSSGFRTSDSWLVSAHEASDLQIMPPEDFAGSFSMEVRLIRGQNVVARTNVVRITFTPEEELIARLLLHNEGPSTAAIPEAAAVVTLIEPEPVLEQAAEDEAQDQEQPAGADEEQDQEQQQDADAETPAPSLPVAPEQEAYLLGLAQKMLDQNDIGAARSIYRRLAYQKSALGTLRLAQSYDPAFLSQFRTANVLDDLEQARRWYRRAADLGADEASQRLTALDAHFD